MNPTIDVRTVTGALTSADAAHAHAIAERAEQRDSVAPLSEQAVAAIDGQAHHLFTDHGYANILVPSGGVPMIELAVDPEHRNHREGATLLAASLRAALKLGEHAPQVWAHGDLPCSAGLAGSLDLRRVRELLQLRRPLPGGGHTGIPELPELPAHEGIVLRTYAGPADDAEILRVNNEAFSWHPEQGGWDITEITARTGADWFDPAGLFLAFDAGDGERLLGFHWTKVHPGAAQSGGDLGEVYIVGVDPDAQGRGLGGLLTLAGLRHLAFDRGLDEVELYVEGDNTAALATYRRLGFERWAVDVAYAL
ncbi:mycothiol synthase [Gordonia sp. VNK21]|uniref:mycothiol synthase n=1 Tax=Gordonia sp. VNK21 TaxID=3382483 RepID=UPI0038D3F400